MFTLPCIHLFLFSIFFLCIFSFAPLSLSTSCIHRSSTATFDRMYKRVHNTISLSVSRTRTNPSTHTLSPFSIFHRAFQEQKIMVAVAQTPWVKSKRICRTFCKIAHRKINNTKNIESRWKKKSRYQEWRKEKSLNSKFRWFSRQINFPAGTVFLKLKAKVFVTWTILWGGNGDAILRINTTFRPGNRFDCALMRNFSRFLNLIPPPSPLPVFAPSFCLHTRILKHMLYHFSTIHPKTNNSAENVTKKKRWA